MRPSLHRFGAQLLDFSAKPNYPIAQKPGVGASSAFFNSDQAGRRFPGRKSFQFEGYHRILSRSKIVLAFQYNNLSSAELRAVRAGLLNVKVPEGMERFEMTVARSGIVGAACKKHDPLSSFRSLLSGPMLLLHSSSPLTPSYLSSIFSQIDKTTAFRLSPGLTKAPQPFHSTSALTSPTEASATVVNPKIFCVGGMVDGHVVGLDAIRTIGTLPSLKELQSQLVGLIGSPAAQIAAVLGMASGGQLSRVLESLKVKLEEEQGGKAA